MADPRLQFQVVRCQAGDEAAFTHLLETFGPRTLRYLRGLVGPDAEDVQQEVWLSVYRGIAGLADPAAFRTWLFSTTRRRAIDCLRRLRRERELFLPADDERLPEAETAGAEAPLDPADLDRVLEALPAAQREVLLLRLRDELTYGEIAVITGCPVGTVRTRLHHARRKVREHLLRREP